MKSARRSTCDGTRSTLPAGDAHPSLWCPQCFPRLHHTLPAWLTFTRPVPLGGQTGPARPKAPILSHAVRLSSGQTHPPALLASEILSSGRTSQVALGSLPGVKDQASVFIMASWVRCKEVSEPGMVCRGAETPQPQILHVSMAFLFLQTLLLLTASFWIPRISL